MVYSQPLKNLKENIKIKSIQYKSKIKYLEEELKSELENYAENYQDFTWPDKQENLFSCQYCDIEIRKCTNFKTDMNRFHSEILASLNFNKNKMLSPQLENNHTLKCCSDNFLTKTYMLEKYQNKI